MRKILNKPLEKMTGEELERVLIDLENLKAGGVTPNLAECINMISDCVEVELANR